jgi:transmembrane sensor
VSDLLKPFGTSHPKVPADPDEAGAYWIARRRLGLFDAREETAFQSWLLDARNARAFEAAESAVEVVGSMAAHPDIAAMRDAALAMTPSPFPKTHWGRWTGVAAAVVGIALTVGLLWPSRPMLDRQGTSTVTASRKSSVIGPTTGNDLRPPATVYSTQKGRQQAVTLDDSSVVTLDTATIVQVAYSAGRRDVTILQGQAYFQVAKDKRRPFVVLAGDRRITAVGTEFDVRVDRGRVRVSLIEGRVTVDPIQPTGLARFVPALATQRLDAGEELVAMADGRVSVAAADVERASRWQQDQVIFRDDTLEMAVAEMNRYSATPIVVDDPKIGNLRISGVFGTDRQDNFLAAVTTYYPLSAERRPSGSVVLVWHQPLSSN